MPQEGSGSGLVSGYQGRGAATVLAGGEQDPLAVLQRKKAIAADEKQQRITGAQEATGDLTGAWDRDIPGLAQKRGAYIKLNSHWMQQGSDPRDPSNPEVYEQNRQVYGGLQDKFKASGQHKELYDASMELLSKDKGNKYDRETSSAALEQWAALPIEERMNTPMPIPTLRPEDFSPTTYASTISKMLQTEMESLKPYTDSSGARIFPSKSKLAEGSEEKIWQAYLEEKDRLIKQNKAYDGEEGFQKFRKEVISGVKLEAKQQIRSPQTTPAWMEKGKNKRESFIALQDRIAKAQVGDTRILNEMVNLRYGGKVIRSVSYNDQTGIITLSTVDRYGDPAEAATINTKHAESFGQLLNVYSGGSMSEQDMIDFQKIPQTQGYENIDISDQVNEFINSVQGGNQKDLDKFKGKPYELGEGSYKSMKKIKDVEYTTERGLWDATKAVFGKETGEGSVKFTFEDGSSDIVSIKDYEKFKKIYETAGFARREAKYRKGEEPTKEEPKPKPDPTPGVGVLAPIPGDKETGPGKEVPWLEE